MGETQAEGRHNATMPEGDAMTQEPITLYVLDVVKRTGLVIRSAAQLGYETLLMAKAAHSTEWVERDEAQLTVLRDIADGKFRTIREANDMADSHAEDYLRMYGGSKKGMERGLQMLKEKKP